jgi:hypothetical protein
MKTNLSIPGILLSALLLPAAVFAGDLKIDVANGPNPWTSLDIKDGGNTVRFVVLADRTCCNRPGVFAEAVKKVNLLEPQFVTNVGDLIDGYTEDRTELAVMWKEVMADLAGLKSPFFFTPGNHDLTNPVEVGVWNERLGRTYYHFIYKDLLFLVVCTEVGGEWKLGAEQVEYFRKVLAANPSPKWTFAFMHKPMWTRKGAEADQNYTKFEEALGDRPCTLFAGHEHQYTFETRGKRRYYTLATTGGGNDLRGKEWGEFDQVVMVTAGPGEPQVADLDLNGFIPDDVVTPATRDRGGKLAEARPRQQTALVTEAEKTDAIDVMFACRNYLDIPVMATIEFGRAYPFTVEAQPGAAVVPAGVTGAIRFRMKAPKPAQIDGLGRIPYTWKVVAHQAGSADMSIKGGSSIGFERPRPASRVRNPVTVDGVLGEWGDLPYECPGPAAGEEPKVWKNAEDASFKFDVRYDDGFVYVAARVTDDSVVAAPGVNPWDQDGIMIGVNGLASADWGPANKGGYQSVFMSPGKDAAKTILWGPEWVGKGVKTACVTVNGGYAAEVAIPVELLNGPAGKSWKALRIYVNLYEFDASTGGQGTYFNWQTDPDLPGGNPGWGAFIRR